MSTAWNAVYRATRAIVPEGSRRIANLAIAAASQHTSAKRRIPQWGGHNLKQMLSDLALEPLPVLNGEVSAWKRLANLAYEAADLGSGIEGMYSWAGAYQRALDTQKQLGAYATHYAFAKSIVRLAMLPHRKNGTLRIVDPCAGAGNLLLAAIEQYARGGTDRQAKNFILSVYGVEIDPCARELCCLLIWLASASCGVTLGEVARNIRVANALTHDWWSNQDLFDVLLINPPWESLRHKVENDDGGHRAATLERLSKLQPGAQNLPPLFSAQGTGDRNLYKAFVELVPHLLVEGGRLGAFLPAAFASHAGLKPLRERYFSQFEIDRWTTFENRAGCFPIDSRYKFGLLSATRSNCGTKMFYVRGFAVKPADVGAPHILLKRKDLSLVGGKYHIIPELLHQRELEILRCVLKRGLPFFECGPLGEVRYKREIDLSLARDNFFHIKSRHLRPCQDGTFVDKRSRRYVPLLEGRIVGAYDCFQKTWVSGAGRTAIWVENGSKPLEECYPQYVATPASGLPPRVALCDVTAATNTRTVIATLVPSTWRCGNTAPVLEFGSRTQALAGLGILNSMVFDWIARRFVSGLHLNKFILGSFVWPVLTPQELERVALAAWSVCVSRPRSGLSQSEQHAPHFLRLGIRKKKPMPPIAAQVSIEVAVARGLGLSRDEMAVIYDPDRNDRRGFWRFFDSEPNALEVARGAILQLGC